MIRRSEGPWPPADVAWARTPPACAARCALLIVLLPALAFLNPVSVIGRKELRTVGPALFVANHQSHLDVFACLMALGTRRRRTLLVERAHAGTVWQIALALLTVGALATALHRYLRAHRELAELTR